MLDLEARFWDLPALLRLHDAVAAADPDGPPSLQLIAEGASHRAPSRLGFLSGSFNPLHSAHEALVATATRAAGLDRVLLVLSKRTVDKERVSGMSLADRLLVLALFAEAHPGVGVALVNRGLYVDQAALLRSAWPGLAELWAIVGFDKIVQIFDPRYYADRDAALEELFSLAGVLVAPRAEATAADLRRLLDRPENRRFRERVRLLPLPPELAGLSSSDLRSGAGAGLVAGQEVPGVVRAFVASTHAYSAPRRLSGGEEVDFYGLRVALVEALARARPWAETGADLHRLWLLATSDTSRGAELRAWLAALPAGPTTATLRAFQARAE